MAVPLSAVLLAALVVAGCSGSGDDDDDATRRPPETTATTGRTATTEPTDDPVEELPDPGILWTGTFDDADWQSGWGVVASSREENLSVTDEPPARSGRALRVDAPKDNDGYTGYGAVLRTSFEATGIPEQQDAFLTYYVFFPKDWRPYAGGKLPALAGIAPGDSPNSTSSADTYRERSWWGGLMWSPAFEDDPDQTPLQTYVYARSAAGVDIDDFANPSSDRLRGIDVQWRKKPDYREPWSRDTDLLYIKRGKWNLIELRYKMNTPGKANGIYQGWLNGQLGVDLRDVMYRTTTDDATRNLSINQLLFANFYGGPTSNETNQVWYIDDVVISKRRTGAGVVR